MANLSVCNLTIAVKAFGYYQYIYGVCIFTLLCGSFFWVLLFLPLLKVKTLDTGVKHLLQHWTLTQVSHGLIVSFMFVTKMIQISQLSNCGLATRRLSCAVFQFPNVFVMALQRYVLVLVAADRLHWTKNLSHHQTGDRGVTFQEPPMTSRFWSNGAGAVLLTVIHTAFIFVPMLIDEKSSKGTQEMLPVCTTYFLYVSPIGIGVAVFSFVVDLVLPIFFYAIRQSNIKIQSHFLTQGTTQSLSIRTTLKRNITISWTLLLVSITTLAKTFIALGGNTLILQIFENTSDEYLFNHLLYITESCLGIAQAALTLYSLDALKNVYRKLGKSSVEPQPATENINNAAIEINRDHDSSDNVAQSYFMELQNVWTR